MSRLGLGNGDSTVTRHSPGSPGGTAKKSKGDLRLEKVLDAAEEILKRQGSEGLSVRGVAQKVGMSVGNLQYYLPTRAMLLDAIFQRRAKSFRENLFSAIESVDDPRRRLETLLDLWLSSHFQADQALFWHLWAMSAHDRQARETMNSIYGELITFVAALLREINRDLTVHRARRRAALMTSIVEGSGLFVGYGRTPSPALASLQNDIRSEVLDLVDRPVTDSPKRTTRRKAAP
jgi:AcrR family transcriptional regulator